MPTWGGFPQGNCLVEEMRASVIAIYLKENNTDVNKKS
jgi:hypothetical protein